MNPFLTERVVKLTWDIPNHPEFDSGLAANASGYDPNAGEFSLPSGAIIQYALVDVETTCTTESADAGTASLGYEGALGAFVAAIAVSDASNVWDAGLHGTLIGNPALDGNARTAIAGAAAEAASLIKLSASKKVKLTIATQTFLTGKVHLYIKYMV